MVRIANVTADEFEEIVNNNKIVAIGAGKALRTLLDNNQVISNNIITIIDNNKANSSLAIGERKVPIVSFDDDLHILKDSIVILSTVKYLGELLEQMNQIESFNGAIIYVPDFIQAKHKKMTLNKSGEDLIPKIIHYCWFGGKPLPKEFSENVESWRRFCPDYEIKLWTEENYDVHKNLYMSQAYKAKKWGFVPDYARLDIVNTYGGIYLDTDVELIKNIDVLLKYSLYCGFEDDNRINFGHGFGATKNNAILKQMLDQYEQMTFINEDGSLNLLPSPNYQTEILMKNGLCLGGDSQENDMFAVFSKEYFAPFNMYGVGRIEEETFSIHKFAATWFNDFEKEKLEHYKQVIKASS